MRLRMSLPRVSLIIPCFTSHEYVATAVRSALSQTYGHVEVIVAPDDGTSYLDLRRMFSSPQLRIIGPGPVPASGPGPTRNRAIDAATGDFLAMLDADDVIPPTYLSDLMAIASADGVAIGRTRYVTWDSHRVVRDPPMHNRVLSLIGFGQLLASVHPIFHRSLEPGYFGGFAEDVLHDGTVIAKVGTIPVVDSAVYAARERSGSLTSTGSDDEARIQRDYADRIDAILRRPTSVGLQGLTSIDRADFATLFRFRAMASAAFQRSGATSYNAWVSGREAALWDQYMFPKSSAPADAV